MHNDQSTALELSIYEGITLVRRTTVTGAVIKLGRSERSDIYIDDPAVGAMHAVVELRDPDEATLVDLGNEPRARVNGVAVDKARLKAGDEIALGRVRLVVERIGHPVAGRIANAIPLPPRFDFGDDNPFMVKPPTPGEREGAYEYRLVVQATPPTPAETDSAANGIAVTIRWGRSTLHVAHLGMEEAYYVGDDETVPVHFSIPAEKLNGLRRAPLAIDGAAVIWPGARGKVTDPGGAEHSLEAAQAAGRTRPCAELAGAELLPLVEGTSVEITFGDMTFELRGEKRGRKLAGWSLAALATGAAGYVAASFVAHTGLLGALALLAPPLGTTSDDAISDDQRYLISQYLDSAQEKEREHLEKQAREDSSAPTGERAGEGARGEEGKAGAHDAPVRNAKLAVKDTGGPPQLSSRHALLEEAANMGMVGLLNGLDGTVGAPVAAWGDHEASGHDDINAQGNMWGDAHGAAWGPGGLGLTGIGEGGGRLGHGIGLTNIGTIGGGFCHGCDGFGRSHGRLTKRHVAASPLVRSAPPAVSGRIPPEVIQRIVRINYGRFRACYESGLRSNPNLAGAVTVNFIINRDGQVSSVGGGGSLPDSAVVSCISNAFYGLTFPQPEGGIVTVSYSLSLTPGS
jgi:pSer/pThr/pTyr-binding forkhead associated (FHA) protein